MIGPERFVEVYIRAPFDVCAARDPKGLYARALRGEITNMTGIQDPYEAPERPDLMIDTSESTPEASVDELITGLRRLGRIW